MRQASWEEMWRAGERPEAEPEPVWWRKFAFFSWEELVTFVIVLIGFVTVVRSIENADWVAEMPSLFPIAILGLAVSLMLSRVTRLNEVLLHLGGLAIGFVATFYFATESVEGSVIGRSREALDRIYLWGDALINGGISNDNLPFVVLVVAATYLMAYLSTWSIFRWYNAWLGLIPPGLALLTNISYLPGQRSVPLLIYLFCAILLLARVNVLRSAREWREDRTSYPDFISLHVLNVTVWVGLLLLALAWLLPIGSGSGAFYSLWQTVTSPIAGPLNDLGRVFSAIDSKKGGTVHRFGSTLPLQGEISLGGGDVMEVTANEPTFLRAQSYDTYTAQGWKIGGDAQITTTPWPALRGIQSVEEARRQYRRPISIEVKTLRKASVIVSAGQPLSVNVDARLVFGSDPSDLTSIRPNGKQLNEDTQYRVDSTVTNATVERLRAAGTNYPAWTKPYLQLPDDLPERIAEKSREVSTAARNPYDRAVAVEQYLRTYAVDTTIDPAPPKRDSVDYFLFTLYRGYFDYHASAMVVMLRTLGIPARLAVGYTIRPQDRIPDTSTYMVSEANAFAWPEVYFPNLGWVEFNPTPNEPRITRSGSDDQEFFGSFDEEEFLDELPFDAGPSGPFEPAPAVVDTLQDGGGTNLISQIIVTGLLAIVAFTIVIGGGFQYLLRRGLAGYPYPVQVWEQAMRLSRWAKIRPRPEETPRDIVARLHRALPEVDDVAFLGESFQRARYGQKSIAAEEKERLDTVWRSLRKTLLQRILRMK